MDTATPVTVRVVRRLDGAPGVVFDAWLDPKIAGKFLFATPAGRMVRAEIDARVGGNFAFVDRGDGEDVEHVGEYLEIDRPRLLVFTLAVPKFSSQRTRVSIDIVPDDAGCALTLSHEGALPDYASRTEQGWGNILDGLAGALGLAVRRLRGRIAQLPEEEATVDELAAIKGGSVEQPRAKLIFDGSRRRSMPLAAKQ
jgi:uncharacterized protein YndB with AHSA1/START domain